MATQADLNFVQQLYVAYYGRPADSAGLQYWADRAAEEGQGAIVNAFGESQEFQDEYGSLSNKEQVNNLYQQMFGRDAEEAGLDYWTGQLDSGDVTLAGIANTIANGAQNNDEAVLEGRVEVADAYTQASGDNYEASQAKSLIQQVEGADVQADIDNAKQEIENLPSEPEDGSGPFTLEEALQADELPEGYTLSNASADLGAVAVADLANAQAEAQSVIDGAANAGELELSTSYSLEDSLANIAAADDDVVEGAESYTLTDASADLGSVAVADLADAQAEAQAVVDGAANAGELELSTSYTIDDTLPNLLNAEEGVVDGAASYTLDTSVPRINNSATVAEAAAVLNTLAGAANADEVNVADVYVWQVEDTAENIVAAADSEAVQNAGEVRVSFAEGDQLTVEQAEALAALDNLAGELPPVDQEGAVLAGLQNLEAAQNAEANFLDANADNALLEGTAAIQGVAEGEQPSNEEVATAIEQADTAADGAVVTAENDVLDAEATLVNARAEKATIANTSQAVLDNLNALNIDTRLSDANLAAAATEAQADVDADEALYNAAGTTVANADGSAAANFQKIYTQADGTLSTTQNDGQLAGYVASGSAPTFTAQDTAMDETTVNFDPADFTGNLTLTFTPDGGSETDVTLTLDNGAVTAGAGASSNVTVENDDNGTVTVSGLTASTTGAVTGNYDYTAASLVETQTAAELQAAIDTAETAVDNFVAANGDDAALLDEVRDAINAHIGAGGENTTFDNSIDSNANLLALRDDIASMLDVEGDAEVNTAAVDALADAIGKSAFEFTAQGDETLTAQQQAVNSAFADAEERVALDNAVDSAETAFGKTDVGSVFNTVEALQEERDALIEAVSTAESDLSEAQSTAEQTQALVDDLEALEQQETDAEASLTGAPEDGGLGVNLVDFVGNTATATAEDDVILFSAAGEDSEIANFGVGGEDRLYVGTDFTQAEVAGDVDVATTSQGDASVQELFVQQTAEGNTLLSFENEAFAGSATSGADLTQVTLTGVTSDVSISDDGFLTIA